MFDDHLAYWKSRAGGRKFSLWEGGGGFGDRLLATLEKRPNGAWRGCYGSTAQADFPSREAALQEFSRRASTDFDVEVRTSTRVIQGRPSGMKSAA